MDGEAWWATVRGVAQSWTQLKRLSSSSSRKQPKCPSTDEQIKMWYIYIMEYYSAIKKSEIMPSATIWMNLEIITLN